MSVSSPRVAVVLSVYNPDPAYLRVQLESVFAQTVPASVYVRDDGSTDRSAMPYLESLAADGRISLSAGENRGFTGSFLEALSMTRGEDYFAFCDQDDRWVPEKLEWALSALDARGASALDRPVLYFSHYVFCDGDLNPVRPQAPHPNGPSFRNALVDALVFGMVSVFNVSLKDSLLAADPTRLAGHDWWAYLVASGLGEVIEDDRVSNLYRRHQDSVTTAGVSFIKQTVFRIRTLLFGDELKRVQSMIEYFALKYESDLSVDKQKVLNLFLPGFSFKKALIKTFYPHAWRQNYSDELGCRLMFLLGKL